MASGLRTLSGCSQEVLRALYWKNSPLRFPPELLFASCVAGCVHELWYVEDVGEPLASRGVAGSPGRKDGGVECFLCDAGACKKFHDDIFIAVLVVCPMLSQLRFGKQVSYVYETLEIEMQPWWCRLYLISHPISSSGIP